MHVRLFAQPREYKSIHTRERYVHTRTRVTSCPRPNTPPPSLLVDRPPFGIPSRHPPRVTPLPCRAPPQAFPRRFIDRPQSPAPAILPLHPPLRPPKVPISFFRSVSFSPSAVCRFYMCASFFFLFHSAAFRNFRLVRARAIRLSTKPPFEYINFPSKLTPAIGMTLRCSPSPRSRLSLIFATSFPSEHSASLHIIALKGDTDYCSLPFSSSLSLCHDASIAA